MRFEKIAILNPRCTYHLEWELYYGYSGQSVREIPSTKGDSAPLCLREQTDKLNSLRYAAQY